MEENAFVAWVETPEPWLLEQAAFQALDLPLNLQHNSHNRFHAPSTLYVSALNSNGQRSALFTSGNGGRAWPTTGLRGRRYGAGDVGALALDPSKTGTIYAGMSAGGVLKSTDGGLTWKATNNGLR